MMCFILTKCGPITNVVWCVAAQLLFIALIVIMLLMLFRPQLGVALDKKWIGVLCRLFKGFGYELKLVSVDEKRAIKITRRNGYALLFIVVTMAALVYFCR